MQRLVIVLLILVGFVAHAENIDKASEEAIQNTSDVLNNKNAREKAVQGDPRSKAADDYAKAVTGGGQNLNEVYGLSSEIFEFLAKKYNGNPEELQKVLLEAGSNPEAFYKSLPPEIRDKVRGMASKVPTPQSPAH